MREQSQIDAINQQDAHNLEQTRLLLGFGYALPNDVSKVYDVQLAELQSVVSTIGQRYALTLFLQCKKHLVLAILSLSRLHSQQAFAETRAAVEAVGIARLVCSDSKALEIFLNDDGSADRVRQVRNAFSSGKLFPTTDPLWGNLKEQWETGSRFAHGNRQTLVRQLTKDVDTGSIRFWFQDLKQDEAQRDLPMYFYWICYAHLIILSTTEKVFEVNLSKEGFWRELSYARGKLIRFYGRYGTERWSCGLPPKK